MAINVFVIIFYVYHCILSSLFFSLIISPLFIIRLPDVCHFLYTEAALKILIVFCFFFFFFKFFLLHGLVLLTLFPFCFPQVHTTVLISITNWNVRFIDHHLWVMKALKDIKTSPVTALGTCHKLYCEMFFCCFLNRQSF